MGGQARLDVEAALRHFSGCPYLGPHVPHYERPMVEMSEDHYRSLVRAVVFQQLSGVVANAIFNRFLALFPGEGFPTPDLVAEIDIEQMRSVGLSRQKAAYIHDLSAKVLDGSLGLTRLDDLDDDAVRAEITQVKGFGVWSADMFLIFAICRPDVWPSGDLGVRKGLAKLLGRDDMPAAETTEFAERWRPHRSAAAWYMWRIFEDKTFEPASPVKSS